MSIELPNQNKSNPGISGKPNINKNTQPPNETETGNVDASTNAKPETNETI